MKFTIFKRLMFGYMVIMLFVIFLAGYMTLNLNRLNHLTRSIASLDSKTIGSIERLRDAIFSQVSFEKKYLISKDKDFHKKFWEIQKYVMEGMKGTEGIADTSEKKKLSFETRKLYDRYVFLFREEVDFIAGEQSYSQKEYQEERERIIAGINKKLRKIIKIARSDRDQMIHASSQTSSHVLKVVMVTAGTAIILGVLISFFNTRGINRAILLLQRKTDDIARGKFEDVPNITSPPEIKALADDFKIMCERLKELDQMKIDFISHVSHDLRTPLTAIKEASSMLLEGTYVDVPEKQHELLTITKEECERLIDSVNKILDLSRMEAKMMDYHFRQCSLAPVIQRGVLKVAPIALRKKISLELKPPPDIPPVRIDEERIGQVVQNLIGNALKFTREGDFIVIKISPSNTDKGFVEVSVSDTGCGIQEDNLDLIFDKFKQIDSGIQTVRGTGLGLSIAKHIITAHGGKIWAESEPGKGSSFFFTLSVS
ncbi:MAG: HAMP domain-containing histidine kinase [Deltaproteobacteria bacterium]|nr:HAMP domain-containing histidine kinase [Deltaproteobacteria bacterium]